MTWTKNSNIKTSTSGICTTRVEVGQPVNGDQTIIAKPLSTLIYRLCKQISISLLETLLVRDFHKVLIFLPNSSGDKAYEEN